MTGIRDDTRLQLRFTGPLILAPLWHLEGWWVTRWIGHDCDRQPITCRMPCELPVFRWVSRDQWVEDTE